MFDNLSEKLEKAFKKFRNKGKLTEADVKVNTFITDRPLF